MLFVRGIKGKIKLNPAVKIWGSLLLLVLIVVGGLLAFRNTVEQCWERGGVWIGGALRTAYCAEASEQRADW